MILRLLWILASTHITLTWVRAIRRGWQARQGEVAPPKPRPEELPPVSVIVPAWNEKGTIERNIGALRRVDYPRWEAIIVAGGDDGTYAAAEHALAGDARFRVMERGPEPKNAALTRGVEAAQYDVVVLLDCDNIVEPGWLAALMEPIAYGAAVAVGHSHPNRITPVTLEERMWHIHAYQVLKLSWIQGDRSIAIRRDLLARIGGLPTHTYAREDWDIWARLGDTGERVVFAEGAHLTTDRPATVRESWRHQVRWRRTHLMGVWEHRAALSKQPADLIRQLYPYLQSAGLALLAFLALPLCLLRPAWSRSLATGLALVLTWLGGRRAAIAGEVTAYTGDGKWIGRAWMPALNLLLVTAASVVALLTPRSAHPLYKGPRNASQAAVRRGR